MKINDSKITERLEEIRRLLGVDPSDFIPQPFPERVDMDLTTPEAVESLFNPSGVLIHDGRPTMVYIRDHTVGEYSDDPAERKKLHFTDCQTLRGMKRAGRFERYRLTNRRDNRYLVDIPGGRELDGQILYPCKHCLAKVDYQCYGSIVSNAKKSAIVREFDAKEAYHLLWQHFNIFRRHTLGLKSAREPSGYSKDWRGVSWAYRLSRNFTCEQCGVQLGSYRKLVDTHHDDGDKRNNSDDNLRCLCKLCHAKNHWHYKVSEEHRRIIKDLRKVQGVSVGIFGDG